MKKRILSLVAALALAATVVAPVQATTTLTTTKDANGGVSFISTEITDDGKDTVNSIVDKLSSTAKSANGDLKPSGAANAKANVVTGSAKDNLMDNGIKPAVKEFVKVSKKRQVDGKAEAGKCGVESLRQIYYFNLTADQPGDVTFKIDQDENGKAQDGDSYAIILHYTGNAADEDGITAQYCKISSAGKVTAHFNSYSPVGIIATTSHSAQELVNTYSHSAGSDAGNAAATTTTPAVTAPVVDPNAAVAAPVDGAAAAAGTAAANGKGAASPKTSDNAYAMYLILAVAAVAGTTLVATKKTR
jgi:hypothetical protein